MKIYKKLSPLGPQENLREEIKKFSGNISQAERLASLGIAGLDNLDSSKLPEFLEVENIETKALELSSYLESAKIVASDSAYTFSCFSERFRSIL